MNIILFLILLAIVFAVIFVFRGWPFSSWRDGYKNAGVRMSFVEFRRIYELAPSKWRRYGDYTYRRDEWIPNPENGFPVVMKLRQREIVINVSTKLDVPITQ